MNRGARRMADVALLLFGAGALCSACSPSSARVSSGPIAETKGGVHPQECAVRAGRAEDVFLLTGELNAVRSLDLTTPRTEAWQVQIKWIAEDGSELAAGNRAVEFDNSQVVQTIEEKKLHLIQSEIELESKSASLEAEREDKRFALERAEITAEKARMGAAIPQELLERRKWQENQGALRAAEAALEKARLELEAFETSSKADLEILRIAHDKAGRDIEAAQRSLESLALKAPRDGIFVVADYWREERKYQVGDTTWPGQTIATIPDLSEMEVVGRLSQVDDGRIAPGMTTRCVLDTYPDRVFAGKIEEVAAIAEEGGSRTRGGFLVRIRLDRSDPSVMRPGMSVRVEVVRRTWDRALTVPRQAVRRAPTGTYIIRPGGSAPTEVKIAACTPTDCIVASGLSEGDRVLVY